MDSFLNLIVVKAWEGGKASRIKHSIFISTSLYFSNSVLRTFSLRSLALLFARFLFSTTVLGLLQIASRNNKHISLLSISCCTTGVDERGMQCQSREIRHLVYTYLLPLTTGSKVVTGAADELLHSIILIMICSSMQKFKINSNMLN